MKHGLLATTATVQRDFELPIQTATIPIQSHKWHYDITTTPSTQKVDMCEKGKTSFLVPVETFYADTHNIAIAIIIDNIIMFFTTPTSLHFPSLSLYLFCLFMCVCM